MSPRLSFILALLFVPRRFTGLHQLKAVIQMLAASYARREVFYCPFEHELVNGPLQAFSDSMQAMGVSVKELYENLMEVAERLTRGGLRYPDAVRRLAVAIGLENPDRFLETWTTTMLNGHNNRFLECLELHVIAKRLMTSRPIGPL